MQKQDPKPVRSRSHWHLPNTNPPACFMLRKYTSVALLFPLSTCTRVLRFSARSKTGGTGGATHLARLAGELVAVMDRSNIHAMVIFPGLR